MNTQLELFSQSKDNGEIKSNSGANLFLRYIRNYEKAILIIIGLIITSIISFSLGVERGRKVSLSNASPLGVSSGAHSRPDSILPRDESKGPALPKEKEEVERVPVKVRYVIQLASYKTKTYAQREAELLKKKGLRPSVLSKGSYIVLYVGGFSDKKSAQSVLSQLKKRYGDCYIRRL